MNRTIPTDTTSTPPSSSGRKKLILSPRSPGGRRIRLKSTSARGDPFAGASPREQNLARKGVDPSKIDKKVEQKAQIKHYSVQQELKLEKVQQELVAREKLLREANEKELPAEKYREEVEEKRKELDDLILKFSEQIEGGGMSISRPGDNEAAPA